MSHTTTYGDLAHRCGIVRAGESGTDSPEHTHPDT